MYSCCKHGREVNSVVRGGSTSSRRRRASAVAAAAAAVAAAAPPYGRGLDGGRRRRCSRRSRPCSPLGGPTPTDSGEGGQRRAFVRGADRRRARPKPADGPPNAVKTA